MHGSGTLQRSMKSKKKKPANFEGYIVVKCDTCKTCFRNPREIRCIYGGPFYFGVDESVECVNVSDTQPRESD